MKKVFYIFGLFILSFFSSSFALTDCSYMESVKSYCGINGITVTSGSNCLDVIGEFGSKFESWQMPKIYDGQCWNYPQVSETTKEKIYTAFVAIYKRVEGKNADARFYLGKYISNYLQMRLQKEYAKGSTGADLQKMAILHYAGSLFVPAYYFHIK